MVCKIHHIRLISQQKTVFSSPAVVIEVYQCNKCSKLFDHVSRATEKDYQ